MLRISPVSMLLAGLALAASPAFAQGDQRAPVINQCAAEVGFTEDECACVIETARPQLSERQMEYFQVRIARNDEEVARMRTFMGVLERLAILWTILDAAETCAPGKDVVIPRS
jgi:hypothetical protein